MINKRIIIGTYFAIFFCIAILLPSYSYAFPSFSNPIVSLIRSEVAKQASSILGREITVGNVSGGLLDSIVIENIRIAKKKKLSDGAVISVKRAVISYNLIRAASIRDFIPAISKIELDGASRSLEHEKDGSINLAKLMPAGSSDGPAPDVRAKIYVRDSNIKFVDIRGFAPIPNKKKEEFNFTGVNGFADFSSKGILKFNTNANEGFSYFTSKGSIDLATLVTHVKANAYALSLKKWNPYLGVPVIKDQNIDGFANVELSVLSAPKLLFSSKIKLIKAKALGRTVDASIDLAIKNNRLDITLNNASLSGGSAKGNIGFALSPNSSVDGALEFEKLDLAKLIPEIKFAKGITSGSVNITGKLDNLKLSPVIKISAGTILGQNVDSLKGDIFFSKGLLDLKNVAYSFNGNPINISGKYNLTSKDFAFNINSKGYQSEYGKINSLTAYISGQYNEELIKNPLERISIKAKLNASNSTIKNQHIDSMMTDITIDRGQISIKKLTIMEKESVISAEGQMFFGGTSNLKLSSNSISIADLRFLEAFMPSELYGLDGKIKLDVKISGILPKDSGKNLGLAAKQLNYDCVLNITELSKASQDIGNIAAKLSWMNKESIIEELSLVSDNSLFFLKGKIDSGSNIDISFFGPINLTAISPFTQKYAKILGIVESQGTIKGNLSSPIIQTSFAGVNLVYNSIKAEKSSGKIKYQNGDLILSGPVVIYNGADKYALKAKVSINKKDIEYEGELSTDNTSLASASNISQMIYIEAKQKKAIADNNTEKILLFKNLFDIHPNSCIYDNSPKSFLSAWGKIKDESDILRKGFEPVDIGAKGKLSLLSKFSGKGKNLNMTFNLKVTDGNVGEYPFDSFVTSGIYKDGMLLIKELKLKKDRGQIEASGQIDLTGPVSLKLESKNFSINNINTIIKTPASIEGVLTLKTSILGSITSPLISAEVSVDNFGLGPVQLDNANSKFSFANNVLNINKLEISKEKQKATLKGKIPFVQGKELSIETKFDNSNIGLLPSMFRSISWKKGKGSAQISLSGTIYKPIINGYIKIDEAYANIGAIQSNANNFNTEILAKDNIIYVNKFMGTIDGQKTLNKPLSFSIAGLIDMTSAYDEDNISNVDISAYDMFGSVDIPDLYAGEVSLQNISIKGPLTFKSHLMTKYKPLFTSAIALSNGLVILPKNKKTTMEKNIDVAFNLGIDINKNVRLVQGKIGNALPVDMATLDFDISKMDFEIQGKGLQVSGSMSKPEMEGVVGINSGTLNLLGMFGRDFKVVSEKDQELYFGSNLAKDTEGNNKTNRAEFKKSYGMIPMLFVTAKTEIDENPSAVDSALASEKNPSQTKTVIITKMSGIPFTTDKDRAIKTSLYAFSEDKQTTPSKISQLSYSESQIINVLMPDVFKNALSSIGVKSATSSTGQSVNVEDMAKGVMVDYLNARLQSYILGGVSGQIEKSLGLETFSLDYNFGKDLAKTFNMQSKPGLENQTLGVNLAKGFFNTIFISAKYSQAMGETTTTNNISVNYQIIWKIDNNYSLVYYREPVTFADPNSTYYKTTLQSSRKF